MSLTVSCLSSSSTSSLRADDWKSGETKFLQAGAVCELKLPVDGDLVQSKMGIEGFFHVTPAQYGTGFCVTRFDEKKEFEKWKKQSKDSISRSEEPLQNRKIVVFVCPQNGLGDVSGALKIAHLVQQIGPKVAIAYPNNSTIKTSKDVFAKKWEQFDQIEASEAASLKLPFSPDLILAYPFDYGFPSLGSLQRNCENTPVLEIYEYGYGRDNLGNPRKDRFALGLFPNELGIHIDRNLYQIALKCHSSADRLCFLEFASEDLCKKILGESFSKKSMKGFDATTKLYFGYAQKEASLNWFTSVMGQLQQFRQEPKNICLVLIGGREPAYEEEKARLDPSIRIIRYDSICHKDMLALIQASEPECMATGDQSMAECFSALKTVCPEYYIHKEKFLESISKLGLNYNLPLSYLSSNRSAKIAAQTLANLDPKKMKAFAQTICEKHDCKTKVIELVCKTLGSPVPLEEKSEALSPLDLPKSVPTLKERVSSSQNVFSFKIPIAILLLSLLGGFFLFRSRVESR